MLIVFLPTMLRETGFRKKILSSVTHAVQMCGVLLRLGLLSSVESRFFWNAETERDGGLQTLIETHTDSEDGRDIKQLQITEGRCVI